ncbi:DUF4397 domain-containing protein [Barrientosiimonas humi]|uniref:DUF4397 domain-containing protein n=1 Tax=Barrientosiimonas humi TaxID=999931 RepID=UPI00370D9D6B
MRTLPRSAALTAAAVTLALGGAPAGAAQAAPRQADPAPATVYVVQGVAGAAMTLRVDGRVVSASAAAKSVVGPLRLTPGKHTVVADAPGTASDVTATIDVAAGSSTDAVVHRTADASARPVLTTYVNDLSPVPADSARLTVAHTAAVGPADIRVRGKVLFANVANGEELSLTVPAATYPVEIVPTATSGPSVLGPVDLPVKAGTLTRVFAIGVASAGTMDAVVHELPLRGTAGTPPRRVDAGSAGLAATVPTSAQSRRDGTGAAPLALGAGLLLLVGARRVRTGRRAAHR